MIKSTSEEHERLVKFINSRMTTQAEFDSRKYVDPRCEEFNKTYVRTKATYFEEVYCDIDSIEQDFMDIYDIFNEKNLNRILFSYYNKFRSKEYETLYDIINSSDYADTYKGTGDDYHDFGFKHPCIHISTTWSTILYYDPVGLHGVDAIFTGVYVDNTNYNRQDAKKYNAKIIYNPYLTNNGLIKYDYYFKDDKINTCIKCHGISKFCEFSRQTSHREECECVWEE